MIATELDQETLDSWREVLLDFEDVYQPVFRRRGISRDAALLVWQINKMKNAIHDVEAAIHRLEAKLG